MKKRYLFFIILLLLIPVKNVVYASDSGIDKFYMDATVQNDGSILVKELFDLNGTYNGFERIIVTDNKNAPDFNEHADSYGGSKLHNASQLDLIQIKGIPNQHLSIDSLNEDGVLFTSMGNPNYDKYYLTLNSYPGEYRYKIYNKSINDLAFYLEYRLQNMAILHEDIAEIGWNIFSDQLIEKVEEFELLIHLPNNKKELRAWAHGPLNGNIQIIDKETVKVTIKDLNENTPFDVRLVFDKDVIKDSSKQTNITAFNKIMKYEQIQADRANKLRKEAQFKYYGTMTLAIMWAIGWIILIIYTYMKYDKEYKSNIRVPYYRELPNTYGPEFVGYLMNHKIGTDDLSAAIMNLIVKKIIKAEKIETGKKDDYQLTYLPENVAKTDLDVSETILIKWLFEGRETLLLSTFKKEAENDYLQFLSSYEDWKSTVLHEGEKQQFFLKNTKPKNILILYSLLGIFVTFLMVQVSIPFFFILMIIIAIVIGIIYGFRFQKRTKYGNDEYVKWKAFKRFLLDFGNFSEKELPEIALWEKYLVYAVTLGCADKVEKQMEVKVQEISTNDSYSYPSFTDFYIITSLNRSVSSGVKNAVNTAISTRAMAQSSSSSGSGFGGGFSSGGGSFGGGGGGGRF